MRAASAEVLVLLPESRQSHVEHYFDFRGQR